MSHPDPPVYRDRPRDESLAQGDVLESYEFFRPKSGTYNDTVWAPAIILSHSCDFTKFRADEAKGRDQLDRFPLIAGPIIAADEIPDAGARGLAKKGEIARWLYLPGDSRQDAPLNDDHFVSFWFMQPVAVFDLLGIRRLASMGDDWQIYLQLGIDRQFSWLNRKQPVWEQQ